MLRMSPVTNSVAASEWNRAAESSPADTDSEPVCDWRKFGNLCSRDEKERSAALGVLSRTVLAFLDRVAPARAENGAVKDGTPQWERESPGGGGGGIDKAMLLLLLSLSRNCPFRDISEKTSQLLQTAQEHGVQIPQALGQGPSCFIPVEEMVEEGVVQPILREAFVSLGRLDHVTIVMGLHTEYLACFLRTQHSLLQLDGPLPYPWRHFIAIMASARHQCSYLVQLHTAEFLQVGGDPQWLGGLSCAPQKLRNLNELNKLLAHRPWLITKEHIEVLLKPGGEGCWSLAELIHAVVLLTHYHSLSSFVFGCGVNPEPDHEEGHAFRPPSPCPTDSPRSEGGGSVPRVETLCEVEALMRKMKLLQEQEEEASQEEMAVRFEREKRESLLVTPTDDSKRLPSASVSRFVEDPDFGYEDFTRRGEQTPPTFRAQDYSWEDHGYSLMNRLYPDVGQLLDEKFQTVYNLTYNTMAMHSGVDTKMLRKAVWNYIHCVFGIRFDDYDYGDVNHLLERSLKVYIKTVACYPEKTSYRMYNAFWRHFRHSEKVHVNLLLLEARMQAALLYALRAITRYMT
ncbi:sestrin-2-like isoform X2 [Acipenser ruthenus]|uniref:sestrin-2-like isoform X2 n=1 Tax=Acipenser ruthenus TaxID=7906 RepID=UPI0015619423|nr:sestrin-2-like isoform X2 [Acipenser ruthenus]